MRVSWLDDVLSAAGLTVVSLTGWEGRGPELTRVDAVICHATITGRNVTDQRVANLLRDGHSTLPGPLSQLGLARDGRWWLICDGRGNHNGRGRFGNQTIGVEAFNDGTEPWPLVQLDSYQRGVAAICKHLGLPVDRVLAHRESDPGRKSDPQNVDMDAFRRRVAALITTEDDMTDDQAKQLAEALDLVRDMNHALVGDQSNLSKVVVMTRQILNRPAPASVDPEEIAAAIAAELGPDLAAEVLDRLRDRLAG